MKRKCAKDVSKKIGILLLSVALIPLLYSGIRIKDAIWLNEAIANGHNFSDKFSYSDLYTSFLQGGYKEGRPVKEMAAELEIYLKRWRVIGLSDEGGVFTQKTMELPIDLTYYAEPSRDSHITVELKQGETIAFLPNPQNSYGEIGYGCIGLPDYKQGWRCVRPFLKEGEYEELEKLPYYYIPLSDLETVYWNYLEDSLHTENQQKGEYEFFIRYLRYCDISLYEHSLFVSPDLSYPIWDTWDTVLLGGSIVLLLAGSILLLLSRNECAQDEKRKINGAT